MQGAKGVPQAVIVFIVWLARFPPDVLASQFVRHVLRAIERSVEDASFTFSSTLNDDLRERLFPCGFRTRAYFIERAHADFAFEIGACLLNADEGDCHLHLNDGVLPGIKADEEADALFLASRNSLIRFNSLPMPSAVSVERAIKLCGEVQRVRRGIPAARE